MIWLFWVVCCVFNDGIKQNMFQSDSLFLWVLIVNERPAFGTWVGATSSTGKAQWTGSSIRVKSGEANSGQSDSNTSELQQLHTLPVCGSGGPFATEGAVRMQKTVRFQAILICSCVILLLCTAVFEDWSKEQQGPLQFFDVFGRLSMQAGPSGRTPSTSPKQATAGWRHRSFLDFID